MMKIIDSDKERKIWKQIYQIYGFKNYNHEIIVPVNFDSKILEIKINIIDFSYDENGYASKEYSNSGVRLKQIFEKCFSDGIYILDWEHDCYDVESSYIDFPMKDEDGLWLPSYLPEGDTVFFLRKDLKAGWIADFNKSVVILVGKEFIDLVKQEQFLFF